MFDIIGSYILEILFSILLSVVSFIGIKWKVLYQELSTNELKKEIIDTAVKAAEQIFKKQKGKGTEKYNYVITTVTKQLNDRGVKLSDSELKNRIESACLELAKVFKEEGEK